MDLDKITPYTHDPQRFRPCVGAWIVNDCHQLLVAQRLDNAGPYWQAVQGGIDEGEDPFQAMEREIHEEIGLKLSSVSVEAVFPRWYSYRLPQSLRGKLWRGQYIGQQQLWFYLKLRHELHALDLAVHKPAEFMAWKWIPICDVLSVIIPFKRRVYRHLLRQWG